MTQTIRLTHPRGTDRKTVSLDRENRRAHVDGCACAFEHAMGLMSYFVSFGWSATAL